MGRCSSEEASGYLISLLSMNIFIGPHEIAGYYAQLASGFKAIGVKCDFVEFSPHQFKYRKDVTAPYLIRLMHALYIYKSGKVRNRSFRYLIAIPQNFFRLLYAIYAIIRYDAFIFGFGQSLLWNNIDLPILKWLGKVIVSNLAHGAEARPIFIDGGYQSPEGSAPQLDFMRDFSLRQKHRVTLHQRNAIVIGAPFSTSYFAETRFINVFKLGLPFEDKESLRNEIQKNNFPLLDISKSIRILHAPSNSIAKGSLQIIKAIERLKTKGYFIEFILLQGRSNDDVLEEIRRCDLVVDQLYSDTPMAGFAAEAAFFGKPAVVGGYGLEYLKTFVQAEIWPPSQVCHPDEIEQAIEFLIVNPQERVDLGKKAQSFVRKMCSPIEVAKRYLRLIEGDIPTEWWLDPRSVTYLEGAGQPIERTCENIRNLIENYGVECLQLKHRPELEQAFLKVAGIDHQSC